MFEQKKDQFNNEEILLSEFARVLSHPARLLILKTLANSKCICGELVSNLPLAQSTVSRHIGELKDIGLIIGESDGPRMYYRINKTKYLEFSKLMQSFLESIDNSKLIKG